MSQILSYDKKRVEDALIDQVQSLYTDAENKIKHLEIISHELVIPSINELRYAGHHLLKAFTATTRLIKEQHLQKASNHCKRAVYDACEAKILYLLGSVADFQKKYEDFPVSTVINGYLDHLKKIEAIKEFIEEHFDLDDKEKSHNLMEPKVVQLQEIEVEFRLAIPEINLLNQRERSKSRLAFFGIAVAVLTFIATVTIAIFKK